MDEVYDWRECPVCHGPCLEGADSEDAPSDDFDADDSRSLGAESS